MNESYLMQNDTIKQVHGTSAHQINTS